MKLLRKHKITPTNTPESAIQVFIKEWCEHCSIFDLLKSTSTNIFEQSTPPLCPQPLLETCPIYQRIQLLRSVTRKEVPNDQSNS